MRYYINGFRADEKAVLRCLRNEIIVKVIVTEKNNINIITY